MRSLLLAVGAACLAASPARALDPDKGLERCSVQRWQVKDGLPGDSIRALVQAPDGQLWIAALGGVTRYDGIRFAPVTVPGELVAAASDVGSLLAARDGTVWAGSARHAPLRLRGGVVTAMGGGEGLGAEAGAVAWAEDARGQVWLAGSRTLHRFADGRFVNQALRGLGDRRPAALAVDHLGAIWLGTDRGLFAVVGDELIPHPTVPGSASVSALYQDRRRVLWVATGDGLLAVDGPRSRAYRQGLPRGPIAAMADDDDGNLWLGTAEGLVRLREGQVAVFTTRDGLPDDDVTALLVDREGSLWVGTRNGGVVQFSDRTLDARSLPASLDGVDLESVCEDAEGGMWFGTRGRGAIRWKDQRVTVHDARSGLLGDTVFSVMPGAAGEVWIGTARGLNRWRAGKVDDPGLWPRAVASLHLDRQGVLWIGGNGELGRLADGQVQLFGAEHNVPKQVRVMTDEPDGTLWISGNGGLFRLEGGRFVRPSPLGAQRGLGPVRSLLTDREGAIWMTAERVGLLRVWQGKVTLFDASRGLDAEMLYQLRDDEAGDLWVGTNKSILRVSRSSLDAVAEGRRPTLDVVSFETTDRRAGVVATQLKQPAAWKARDGRLWFLTRQGAVTIDPRRVRTNTVPPGIAVEAVIADGQSMVLGIGERHFGPGLRSLEIHYAARTLLEPSKVRYRYRLEGRDPDWVEAGTRRAATYANLRNGSYRFRVQASNGDRVWNERGASYTFTIAPPLYRRAWFYLACAGLLVPLGVLLHRARMARMRAQYVVMFAERSRVARELHDTLLQGMSAVAMQLNGIRMRLSDAPEGARRDLALVQDTVTRCLEETRRVVWDLRDRGSNGGDLGAALTRFARRATQGSAVTCAVRVEGAPAHLPHAVEDQLFRIGQEALTNAIKHAKANTIDVILQYDPGKVTLKISDDGQGFDPAAASGGDHFGLVGLRERAAAIDARLDIRSTPGQGTTVEVGVAA
jgi:signal transduction histidine kinase/ligand-binding sensor domain-containing protein